MSQFIIPLSSLPTISSIGEGASIGQKTQKTDGSNIPFANFLQEAMQDVVTTGEISSQGRYDLAIGATDDLHTGAINSMKASTAVSYATGVASSVIRAYNELIRMQV